MSKKLGKKIKISKNIFQNCVYNQDEDQLSAKMNLKKLVKDHNESRENAKEYCGGFLSMIPFVAGVVGGVGAFSGFVYGSFNNERISQIKEKSDEIKSEILKVAQDKANLFNEKFDPDIPVPTSCENLNFGVHKQQLTTVKGDSLEQVRGSVTDLINEHMVNYKAGTTHGEIHIGGFSAGHGYVDGTDGEIIIEPGFEQRVFDLQKFYRDELGDGLDNQLIGFVDSISPAKDDLLDCTLIGLGIGCAPGTVCLGLAGINCGRMLYHKKKMKQYRKEYEKLCECQSEQV